MLTFLDGFISGMVFMVLVAFVLWLLGFEEVQRLAPRDRLRLVMFPFLMFIVICASGCARSARREGPAPAPTGAKVQETALPSLQDVPVDTIASSVRSDTRPVGRRQRNERRSWGSTPGNGHRSEQTIQPCDPVVNISQLVIAGTLGMLVGSAITRRIYLV